MKKGIIKSGLLKMTACTVLSAAMVLGSAWVPGFNTGRCENQTVAKVYTNSDIVAKADVTLKYSVTGSTKTLAADETPFGIHGKLGMAKVSTYGNALTIVDKDGYPYQLHGASTHGLGFDVGYTFVNKSAFQSVRDEFGVNTIRLAAYPRQYGGYTTSTQAAAAMDTYIQNGVKYATELGMYVIVDWHVHEYNPNETKTEALEFFRKYATMYKDYDNVIFEICNEPTGTNWYNNGAGNDIYTYADSVIRLIRSCGSDALIICGTNTWSQDVEDVAKKPINDNRTLYAFHYYSGTHGESYMTKVENAINAGTPIYISEYGICAASGNGGYDTNMADKWMALCDKYNLSLNCWSLSNKAESA
jgi:endoglucanase